MRGTKVTGYRRIKKVTYKTVTKVVRVTSGDTILVPKTVYPVTSIYGPPAIGDSVPSTFRFSAKVVRSLRACVYAMGGPDGSPLKIGIASHVSARREELQAGSWVTLVVHRCIYGGSRTEAMALERRLISRFKEQRIVGTRGDWFSIDLAAFDTGLREEIHGKP
jgi:hypothetical protein